MFFLAYPQWMQAFPCPKFALSKSFEMRTKQTIAIIGATEKIGTAITKSISKGNYKLLLSTRDINTAKLVVNEIQSFNPLADVEAIDCSVNACWEADIIIMAVPYHEEKEIAEKIRAVANQKIVISFSNPYSESFEDLNTAINTIAYKELQRLLPNSKLIKAVKTTFEGFNEILSHIVYQEVKF